MFRHFDEEIIIEYYEVLTMNEKLMCCASIYFQIEVKVFVEVCGVLEFVVPKDIKQLK